MRMWVLDSSLRTKQTTPETIMSDNDKNAKATTTSFIVTFRKKRIEFTFDERRIRNVDRLDFQDPRNKFYEKRCLSNFWREIDFDLFFLIKSEKIGHVEEVLETL